MNDKIIKIFNLNISENNLDRFIIKILNSDNYLFEAILEAKNCDIKIQESKRQFQLFISQKNNNWISMYWIASYLKIPYQIFTIEQLSGEYEEILRKQIEYFCSFLNKYINELDLFYGGNIEADLKNIQHNASNWRKM